MNKVFFILVMMILLTFGTSFAQEKKEETQPVPQAAKDRMNLYWKYYNNEDWEHLFDLDNTGVIPKEDYVTMKKKLKTDPYVKLKKILEVALEDEMVFVPSRKGWRVEGCTKWVSKDNKESWSKSFTFVFTNQLDAWIIESNIPFYPTNEGFKATTCKKDVSKFPIIIKVSELK